jgi:hypothetical protein
MIIKLAMKFIALFLLGLFPFTALAIDLYVDKDTQQIFAAPGPNREKLGAFEKIEDISILKSKLRQEIEAEIKSKMLVKEQENSQQTDTSATMAMVEANKKVIQNDNKKSVKNGPLPASVSYGKNGFEFKTDNDKFGMAIQNRIQVRYAEPFDSDPRTLEDLDRDENSFMVRRARTKINGHAYQPWIKFYLQYDWSQPVLRDLSLTIDKYKWAQIRVGRGKVNYNNERVTSSGNQQFVNRSIVNDIFTVDRQQGIELKGNIFPGTWHDFTYYVGAYTGMGIGERNNDDDSMMRSMRLQWNAMGGEMKFSQSDTEFLEHPALNISFAANKNRSKCTAFETDSRSCRKLVDVEIGRYLSPENEAKAGQYDITQMMSEVHFKWRGFSLLNEVHTKRINDTFREKETDLLGGFVQAGYFPHGLIKIIPRETEVAFRYAMVDMDRDRSYDRQTELSAVINYFLEGHFNKLSLQVSRLKVEDPIRIEKAYQNRLWAQWDFTF